MTVSQAEITFVRLGEVPLPDVVRLLNEPRNARHMPLAATFSEEAARRWVREKDAQWRADGYGPWAVLVDGVLAGWGGFQAEDGVPDLALVLRPEHWGRGAEIARTLLGRGFRDLGLTRVTVELPLTRRPERVLARWGFVPDGEAVHGDAVFRRYVLTREVWEAGGGGAVASGQG
ncbi:GNAT family N-acetyltransferase [Cellulosimicrobium sp. TH-20]|uniref:GNAT family N-acetyltransferase n=1 Tax=unclassified Cellulosimicrobium TaxID=2624466 RepID=UPI0015839E21